MPHIVIDYSANLDTEISPERLVEAIHAAALGQPAFDAAGIRTRLARREVFRVADGNPDNAYIAVTVRIGPGRDAALRRTISEALMKALFASVSDIYAQRGLALSVEVAELDAVATTRRNNLRDRAKTQAPKI